MRVLLCVAIMKNRSLFVYLNNYVELCRAIYMDIKAKYRKAKDWNHKLSERMKQHAALPEVDHSHHICSHCGYGFDGRCCPQCGMPAGDGRFTFKRLLQNFLVIWGMGNRPMFRTLGDLLWRPGYMIRDYLGGHHLSYFPPFKMLAVLTVFIVFLTWLFNLQDPLVGNEIAEAIRDIKSIPNIKAHTVQVIELIAQMIVYLDKNDLYRILIQNIFVVLATWIVFRKKGYNLVETFFSQIYINCQFHIITIVCILIFMELPPTVVLPYYMPLAFTLILLIYDYRQLYGISLIESIWRTLLILFLVIAIYAIVFISVIVIVGAFDEVVERVPI